MKILVDGKEAVLKQGLSFEYIAENRLFLGRDGYTLSIAFPMKDCAQNVAIFGHIDRLDVAKETLKYECAIIDSRISLFGTLSIVKVSESEVEGQFAEGRCEQTINDPFEDTYINELDLGTPWTTNQNALTTAAAWKSIDDGAVAVALPWINENFPDVPNNWVKYENNTYSWLQTIRDSRRIIQQGNGPLSWQPYLLYIAKRICDEIDYEYDFTEWENSNARHLIICNTLPGSWLMPGFAKALPHWTVSEFFEKLELFLMCEFEFDHKSQSVKMRFSKNLLDELATVKIDDVVDAYTLDVSSDEDTRCDYIAAKRLAYKDCSHSMANLYSCDWAIASNDIIKYETLSALINENKLHLAQFLRGGEYYTYGVNKDGRLTLTSIMYAADVDTYFVFRSIGVQTVTNYNRDGKAYTTKIQKYVLQPINVFGSGRVESDNTSSEEIDFVPVCIMDTYVDKDDDRGYMMFLNPSSGGLDDVDDDAEEGATLNTDLVATQPSITASIINGNKEKTSSFYDEIYLGYWIGREQELGKTPYPIIDSMSMVSQEWTDLHWRGYSMRLHGKNTPIYYASSLPQIDPQQKFKFSWLANTIPNPRAIFHIRGKRYLCEKITATFTEDGMSQLLKGEFYPLLDTDD